MKAKSIKNLNITECLERLQFTCDIVKNVVKDKSEESDFRDSLILSCKLNRSEDEDLIINRLSKLLYEDKKAYTSCKSKPEFQNYLDVWCDGFWRVEAEDKIGKHIETSNINSMELNKCPICGRAISKNAVACPNCGHPLQRIIKLSFPNISLFNKG